MLIVGAVAGWFAYSIVANARSVSASSKVYDIVKQQQEAWNRGDLDGFLSHYDMSEDITFYSDDKVSKGWVALNDRYRRRYGGGAAAMGQLAFDELSTVRLTEDAVLMQGRWTTNGTPNAGTGLFTILIRKTDNGWKIVHDHTSAKKAAE